jgi:SAM-dependent methyltransferase
MSSSIEFYNNNAGNFFDSTFNVDMSELYKEFIPYLDKNSQVLDAGCGSGRDSKYFMEHGYEVTAFDASPPLVKLASKITNLAVNCMTFEDIKWEEKFSGIWACASLLHLDDYELKSAFCKLFRSLNKRGVLYCSFKYGETNTEINGRFFNNMTEQCIKELLYSSQDISFDKFWVTSDKRPGREDEKWLNIIITKD